MHPDRRVQFQEDRRPRVRVERAQAGRDASSARLKITLYTGGCVLRGSLVGEVIVLSGV